MKTKYIPVSVRKERYKNYKNSDGSFNIADLTIVNRIGPRKFNNGLLRVKFIVRAQSIIAGQAAVIDFLKHHHDLEYYKDFFFPPWNYNGKYYNGASDYGRQLYVAFDDPGTAIILKMLYCT